MLRADLYEKEVSLDTYLSANDCRACGFQDREEFLRKLRSGKLRPHTCRMSRGRFLSLQWAARPEDILPPTMLTQEKIQAIIEAYAQEQSYSVIFMRDQTQAYVSPALDVTQEIVRIYNERNSTGAPAAATPAAPPQGQ